MKVYAFSMCFMNGKLIEQSLERFHETLGSSTSIYRHVVLDQHYPLNYTACRQSIEACCKRYALELMDAGRNLGLHEGANFVLRSLNLQDDDVVIAYDPDSYINQAGWDLALVRAVSSDPKRVWASLLNPRSNLDIHKVGFRQGQLTTGERMWFLNAPVANSVCAWRGDWLKRVNYLWEPCAFYGHLECAMWDRMKEDEEWLFLPDYTESDHLRDLQDRDYQVWKWRHAHLKDWPHDFESFVKCGCPETAPCPAKLP